MYRINHYATDFYTKEDIHIDRGEIVKKFSSRFVDIYAEPVVFHYRGQSREGTKEYVSTTDKAPEHCSDGMVLADEFASIGSWLRFEEDDEDRAVWEFWSGVLDEGQIAEIKDLYLQDCADAEWVS